jgi:nitroreductase
VEFAKVIAARHMVRAFTPDPVSPEVLAAVLDAANRAPSAGWSQGADFVVLQGPERFTRYWDLTLPVDRRSGFAWPRLLDAPVLIVAVTEPDAYARRYAQPDKANTGLGASTDAWPVPYWWVDGGMALENLLLAAVDAGLGACLFGLFDHERAVLDALGVPAGHRALATVALGHAAPADAATAAGRSVRTRDRRDLSDVVHHGRW